MLSSLYQVESPFNEHILNYSFLLSPFRPEITIVIFIHYGRTEVGEKLKKIAMYW